MPAVDGNQWMLVSVACLALVFIVSQLPSATPDSRAAAPEPEPEIPMRRFVVSIDFAGDVVDVFDALAEAGWRFGGSGAAGFDLDATVAVEVEGLTGKSAADLAKHAVDLAGGALVRVGEPIPIP